MELHTDLPNAFKMSRRYRKHLVFFDSLGAHDPWSDVQPLAASGCIIEWNSIGAGDMEGVYSNPEGVMTAQRFWSVVNIEDSYELRVYVEQQPIGTQVHIRTQWVTARSLVRLLEEVGYAMEDIQVRGYGPKYHQMFCVGCYTISLVSDSQQTRCPQCGRWISASDHYSRRLDAVMGYVVLPNTMEKGNL